MTLGLCTGFESLEAQEFVLRNGDNVELLDYNTDWYVVQRIGLDDECCNNRRYLGNFIAVAKDSIQLRVQEYESRRADDDKSYYANIKFNTQKELPVYTMAKADLLNIQEKEQNWKTVLGVTGVALLFTTVGTAIHGLIVDGDNRKALLISSTIQLATSITLISIAAPENEKYKLKSDAWQFE